MKNANNLVSKYFDKSDQLHITNAAYKDCVSNLFSWLLTNDHVDNDITTKLLFTHKTTPKATAKIISRNNACIAGIEEITFLIDTFTHLTYNVIKHDGDLVAAGDTLMKISGHPEEILVYERTMLNILQRLIGIATETHKYVSYITSLNLAQSPYIAATRKTIWSLLDKKAVAVGGGLTHRLTLSDGILVKDNHLMLIKDMFQLHSEKDTVVKTVTIFLEKVDHTLIEVEVEQKESIPDLIHTFHKNKKENVLGILLDNFSPLVATELIKGLQQYNLENIFFEASGGITSDNLSAWAKSGVDVISLGALTHSIKAADISLDM